MNFSYIENRCDLFIRSKPALSRGLESAVDTRNLLGSSDVLATLEADFTRALGTLIRGHAASIAHGIETEG